MKRDEWVKFRVTKQEKKEIKKNSKEKNLPVSIFARNKCLRIFEE